MQKKLRNWYLQLNTSNKIIFNLLANFIFWFIFWIVMESFIYKTPISIKKLFIETFVSSLISVIVVDFKLIKLYFAERKMN